MLYIVLYYSRQTLLYNAHQEMYECRFPAEVVRLVGGKMNPRSVKSRSLWKALCRIEADPVTEILVFVIMHVSYCPPPSTLSYSS